MSILTPHNYQQCQEFIDKIKEIRFIKVRERQVRKLNILINKKEGGITWQSSQVPPAARAFPRANNRQAGRLNLSASPKASQSSLGERALSQSLFSQADSSQASPVDSTLSPARSVLSQAGSSQASLVDGTLSLAQSALSQAVSSQAPPVDCTLSLAESALSQAGSSQASPIDCTLSLAESALSQAGSPQAGSSQAFLEDSTLSLAQSALSQAGSSQASPVDSTLSLAESALSQAVSSQASPVDCTLSLAESALSQAGSSQASPVDCTLSLAESVLSQAGSPQAGSSQASLEENTLSPESELSQGGSPSSPEDSTLQAESTTPPQAVRCLARLRARQAGNTPRGISEVSQQDTAVPQGVLPQDNASQEAGSFPSRHHTPQGSSPLEEPNPKWVINLSSKPLIPAQRSVLAKGPNFVVTPRHLPNLEYITAIEASCTMLSQQDAEELRADINWVLRSSHPPNLT